MFAWRWTPLLLLLAGTAQRPTSGLQVEFGSQGLERLVYQGQVLADVQRWPEDRFHVWHMKCYDASGRVRLDGQYGWGESNNGRSWDSARQTWTYKFLWGELQVHYAIRADTLDVEVTEINHPSSGVVLDGASIYPLALHLPHGAETSVANSMDAPAVTFKDWGTGEVAIVTPDVSKTLYSGLVADKDGGTSVLVSGTRPDAVQGLSDSRGRMIKPGETDRFVLSVRFAASGTPASKLSDDTDRAWKARWPETLRWTDRRVIGTVFLAGSAQGEKTRPAGFKTNPRRYFSDAGIDVHERLQPFQARILRQATEVVANLKRLDAQGAITWDIEGEEFPQDTSYICAPDKIAQVAPEMESVVQSGPQAGMKLDDAYFKIIRDAHFRVGVCIRPQRFSLDAEGNAHQQSLPDGDVAGELVRKMKYAHDRWGVTLFYLDSTVRTDGSTLPASIIEQAAAAMPDSLLIPEESSLRMNRATAPFKTFLFHGDLGTDPTVRALYPGAFSANMINDVDPAKLAAHRSQFVEAVRKGDLLMVHAGYWQQNNDTVKAIYSEARSER